MSLKRRLARLRSAGPGSHVGSGTDGPPVDTPLVDAGSQIPEDEARVARVSKLRGLLSQMISDEKRRLRAKAEAAPPRPAEPLPGEEIQTPHGRMHRVRCYLEPAHHHGRVAVASALDACPRTLAKLALDPELAAVDPRRLLYLDTETTGLSGGTGTIPFLIGLAWFEDESLCVEQLLLKAPGEEAPMLARLAERIEAASGVVTYNGKSYDWPLLRSRFVMNRVPVQVPAAHLDLLHCARRVFKRRLGQVRLVNMEEQVLGMRRERDVDGAEIPDLFWEFVRGADGSTLAPVIEHNANDVIALAAILGTLAERYDRLAPEHEPADQLGVAAVAARAADADRARRYAEAAAEGGGPRDVTADALWLAAELARQRDDEPARRELLHRGLEAAGDDALRAARFHLALAKLYEHRLRDLDAALVHAQATTAAEGAADRDHRVARILRKLDKARRRAARDAC